MQNFVIYLIFAQFIVILLSIGIKLLFNYLENKKIKSILEFIDKRSRENNDDTTDRLKECIDILKQSNKEGVR